MAGYHAIYLCGRGGGGNRTEWLAPTDIRSDGKNPDRAIADPHRAPEGQKSQNNSPDRLSTA